MRNYFFAACKAVAFPVLARTQCSRMARDGASPVSTRVFPQLVDFATRQIRQDRRFDYHVTRTRHANLEFLCVSSNVLLPSWRWWDFLLPLPLPRRSPQLH